MRIWKSKRGDAVTMSMERIVAVVLLIILFFATFTYIISRSNSEYFEKNYLAMDIGLLTDAALASPNAFTYNYPNDMKDYSLEVKESKIIIYKENKGLLVGSAAVSFFINNPRIEVKYGEVSPSPVKLGVFRLLDSLEYQNIREEHGTLT